MKKLFVLFTLVVFVLSVSAANYLDYVVIGDKTYFSEDVRVGFNNIRISTENGLMLKAPLNHVETYMVDGKLCERLPLICNDGSVRCTALMELVTVKNGLRLYKCYQNVGNRDLGCCFYDEMKLECMFFVYKDGELYLRVDKKNAQTVFPFFGVDFKSSK